MFPSRVRRALWAVRFLASWPLEATAFATLSAVVVGILWWTALVLAVAE
jgi:hypothetical protein